MKNYDYYELMPSKSKEDICSEFEEIMNEVGDIEYSLLLFCNQYNLYFDVDIIKRIADDSETLYRLFIKKYIREISSLQQYKNKFFKDSVFNKKTISNKKFNLLNTLKKEQELLVEKISNAREKGDVGTYKNLIVALRDITRLIHDEEYENRMRKEINDKLYFEVNKDRTDIYYEGKVHKIIGDYKIISEHIDKLLNGNKNAEIYGDTHGFGLGLADHLMAIGYEISETEINLLDYKNGRFLTRKEKTKC